MGTEKDRALVEAALEVATAALIREATLRRLLVAKGIVTAAELEAFRSANVTLIAAEAKTTLAKEIEKAMRVAKSKGSVEETATRHPIAADVHAETAMKKPPKK